MLCIIWRAMLLMCCVMLYHSFLFCAVARPDTDTEAPCKWKNRSRSLCATRKQKTFNTVAYLFSGETHSLIAFHTVHRLSIYYARTIIYCNQVTVLLDNSTFISFSNVAVISLTLAKYFYSLLNTLQLTLMQLIIPTEILGCSLS